MLVPQGYVKSVVELLCHCNVNFKQCLFIAG